MRAVLIHRGLKLRVSVLFTVIRLRAVLIHRGLKRVINANVTDVV